MPPQDGKLPAEPLLSLKSYDFGGDILFDDATRKTSGVFYTSDAKGAPWFDPALRADQEAIDKQIDGTVNVFSCAPSCSSARHFIVTSFPTARARCTSCTSAPPASCSWSPRAVRGSIRRRWPSRILSASRRAMALSSRCW